MTLQRVWCYNIFNPLFSYTHMHHIYVCLHLVRINKLINNKSKHGVAVLIKLGPLYIEWVERMIFPRLNFMRRHF